MAFALSLEQFQCIICLDTFKNPVSIPCGHNFCLECIKRFWDTRLKSECPLCKEFFKRRPELRINVGLKEITEQFKRQRSHIDRPAYRKHAGRRMSRAASTSDVPCDICRGEKLISVVSCLICKTCYCENHLTPHLRDPELVTHKLMDPATFISTHLCTNHNQFLTMFCKKDDKPVCMKCTETDHRNHDTIPIENQVKTIKIQMKKTEVDFQQMIQARIKKIEDIKNSMELSRINKEREIESSIQAFTMAINAIEKNKSLLIEEIEQKQGATERRAMEFMKELGQEINELRKRYHELQYLDATEDPLHLLRTFSSLSAPLSSTNWSKVTIQSDIYIGTVRRAFSKLVDVCHELEKTLFAQEMNKTNQYAEDITLDPVTAAGWLILSTDGKTVSVSNQQRRPPDDPRRFDSCVAVLGKQSFTYGRHYWVVQVGDKTDWDLGVARESIKRKGAITVRPDSGYWVICRRKGGSLNACASPSFPLHLQETPQKVGIFLDYEEGLVSFYNVEAKTHIFTYSGCAFTEPIYPYFNPCVQNNGKNTAPLVICPLDITFRKESVTL
ncbi:E3 ubiquitin-protein ligase TRIM21 [Channa argus]|uniref:E3 ubiquitin-protein ligase TRIM21 n=1 Tax=Channa argus TaxID=215402 RepID=A0A6G1Q5A0_CHAAH|nr:E3 ubiquitin-protein ligase TRIM21 [Channa argus]